MDYSQATYFSGQPYPFMGVPPLTPSTSGPSEDFNTSPPELYEYNDPYAYPPGFRGLPQNVLHGPPTPPRHVLNGVLQQPPLGVLPKEEDDKRGDSQSAEEGDKLTPSQHKRKAQNRAAQRAFRERKERHVKELEAKLASMEAAQQKTTTENEKLKKDLQKISTENEILRATSGSGGGSPTTTGPPRYEPKDFYSTLLDGHENKTINHRIVVSDSGERLYDASATWDFIMKHGKGQLDMADISSRLNGQAKCDGQGPVFEERAIREAMEQSMAESDGLL
ncbi:hypothetical protein MAPG_10727 [Magnaporthiopsis poae ATCC 64411]|uniref:BZIP domain-containing protein n=1 Tax=Magnaporthiopsis poae (strain ATCC 64411 / 73-15) TaxID=644358 RepID=A0A0C4EDD2_MAGP6|nr:hypothetical protein MAPG_10727 [Magnaporthiopsis poae ATCC 64411]